MRGRSRVRAGGTPVDLPVDDSADGCTRQLAVVLGVARGRGRAAVRRFAGHGVGRGYGEVHPWVCKDLIGDRVRAATTGGAGRHPVSRHVQVDESKRGVRAPGVRRRGGHSLERACAAVDEIGRALVATLGVVRDLRGDDRQRCGPEPAPQRRARRADGPGGQHALFQPLDPVAHSQPRSVVARPGQPEHRLLAAALAGDMERAGRRRRPGGEQQAVQPPHRDHAEAPAVSRPRDAAADAVQREPAPAELTALRGVHVHGGFAEPSRGSRRRQREQPRYERDEPSNPQWERFEHRRYLSLAARNRISHVSRPGPADIPQTSR